MPTLNFNYSYTYPNLPQNNPTENFQFLYGQQFLYYSNLCAHL